MVLTFIEICWHLTEKWLSVHQGQKRHLTMTTCLLLVLTKNDKPFISLYSKVFDFLWTGHIDVKTLKVSANHGSILDKFELVAYWFG